jgi:pyruvate-ferredoxin/flavodoxin oxidoreductase
MGTSIQEERKAVDAGYWHLYRFNPELRKEGKNPFIFDSGKIKTKGFKEFIQGEIRYSQLMNVFPERAPEMFKLAEQHARERGERYRRLSETPLF